MTSHLSYIINQIQILNPMHGKLLKNNLKTFDLEYFKKADSFFIKYNELLISEQRTLDYAIECYLKMLEDVNFESVQFFITGEYSNKSFEDVKKRVYDNPEVMDYYMHGLLLSQFLWKHHYEILLRFNFIIEKNSKMITNYLEVGGGHGLYIAEAINKIGDHATYDMLDISKSSLIIAQKLINNDKVNFILGDVFEYLPKKKYDFITMGEVLEHVENPLKLLQKLNTLLDTNGKLFITTPTNAPAIDHIYLFKNIEDIQSLIYKAGFIIEEEKSIFTKDVSKEKAAKFIIPIMYAAVLKKAKPI
jgi:2-polyprenyl-3-methyl-5-hydroxy-6-metoxy-1,4-benzoquinol methylase